MGGGNSKLDVQELNNKVEGRLTTDQVNRLLELFQKTGKKELDLKTYEKLVEDLSSEFPNSEYFKPEYARVIFEMLDKNNNRKLDPVEFIPGIAILAAGTFKDKAALTFDAFDLNKDGFLQQNELTVQLEEVYRVASRITSKEAEKTGGSFGKMAVSGVLGILKREFIPAQIKKIMNADTNKDGKLSRDEWIEAAETNEGIQSLLNPWLFVDQVTENIDTEFKSESSSSVSYSTSVRKH